MALDPVIRGTPNDVIWGTNNLYGTARVLSASKRAADEKDLSLDNNGVPTGSVVIKGLVEYELEIEVLSSTNLPVAGDILNFASTNIYVEGVNERWERKGRKRATITGHTFPS